MMKWKKAFVSLLTIGVLSCSFALSTFAATPYTYTVTLSAGNKGTIGGETKVVIDNLTDMHNVNLTDYLSSVQVTDEKYYVKGIRLSGRDNEDAVAPTAFNVSADEDYVVAYGIKGEQVAYTVNYLDESGNQLSPSVTLYGNVGDKPMVAYRYVEGYVPQALALTKTLSSNAAENVFNFEYKPGESGTVVTTTTQTVVTTQTTPTVTQTTPTGTTTGTTAGTTGGTTAGGTTEGGTTAGTTAGGTTAGGTTEGGTTAGGTTAGGTTEEVTVPDEQTPQSVVDLDNEEVPKADKELTTEQAKKGFPLAAGIALIAISIAAFAMLVVVLLKKRSE